MISELETKMDTIHRITDSPENQIVNSMTNIRTCSRIRSKVWYKKMNKKMMTKIKKLVSFILCLTDYPLIIHRYSA